MKLAVATRSGHKLREIRAIMRGDPSVELVGLDDLGIPWSEAEEEIEVFDTFRENALAKARYFAPLTGIPTVADDSGLVVDALGGRPGVRSKRYSPQSDRLSGEERDRANLDHLLDELGDLPFAKRTARYVCVAAYVAAETGREIVVDGKCEGLILGRPRGTDGFGYDPVFFHPPSGRTMAELSPGEKDAVSHRGTAFRALSDALERLGDATD